MHNAPQICFTFVGEVTRDSRLRRFVELAATMAPTAILALSADGGPGHFAGAHTHIIPMKDKSLRTALPLFWRIDTQTDAFSSCRLWFAADLYSLPLAARAARRSGGVLLYDARELYSSIAALDDRKWTQRFWKLIEQRYAKKAKALFTVNASIADIYRERYEHVHVVRNVPDAVVTERTYMIEQHLGLKGDAFILLSQGGLQHGRGALLYVEALSQLTDCTLVFLGDGPMKGEIELAAEMHGVANRVHFLPAVPSAELLQWTASADIGLCMIENLGRSYYLSLPNKLFEYFAAGLPVIGSAFPEIGSVLKETGAGIAIDPGSMDDFVAAVRRIRDEEDLRVQLTARSRVAGERYQWEKESEVLHGVLQETAGRKQ